MKRYAIIVITAIVLGLYLSSIHSYLLFHSLIEIFTISIAFTLFILVWNTRGYLANNYLRLLGIGYAFIAVIDLLHTLAYKGMNVFPGYGANLPTQLWIAARYLQAFTLFAAPLFVERRMDNRVIFGGYTAIVSALVAMVYSGNFPDCFIEGKGLTTFKISSEYIISAFLLASLYLFYRKRKYFENKVFLLIAASIVCTVLSEILFTEYVSVYGFANMVGHFSKLAAFCFIYQAILVTGIKEPFDLIFRNLKQSEEALLTSKDALEEKVRERTAELSSSEKRYRSLIQKVQTAIVLHDGQGRILISNPLAQRLLSLSEDQLLGKALIDPDWHFLREDGSVMPIPEYPASRVLSSQQPLRNYVTGISLPGRDDVTWALVNAEPEYNEAGAIERIIVSFIDITERKRAEDLLQINEKRYRTAETIGHVGNWEYNLQTTKFWGSDEAKRIYGFDPEALDFSTDEVENCIPEKERVHQALIDLIEKDNPYNLEFEIHPKNSLKPRIISSVAELKRDEHGNPLLVTGVIQDITERKRAEESLHRLNRELKAISTCNQTLLRTEDEQTLLNDICRIVCDEAGYCMAWVGYAEHNDAKTVRPVAWAGNEDGYLANAGITWADTERGHGPTGIAIRTGETDCIRDFATEPKAAPWRDSALQRGYRSSIALPLKDESKKTFGTLTIYSTELDAFTPDEIRLLEELSGDLAFGITVLRGRIEHKQADQEHHAHLRFLESLDQINRAIQGANDLEQMMSDVLEVTLAIFDCDRAFLLYPLDPDAWSWTMPMVRCRPEYPAPYSKGPVPMDPLASKVSRALLASDDPVKVGPGTAFPLTKDVSEQFDFESFMGMALYPKVDTPWEFAIHQCSYDRVWSPEEERLFKEIGRRLGDALTGLLSHRNLNESEERFRRLTENARDVIYRMSLPDGKYEYVSPAALSVFGYSPEEFYNNRDFIKKALHPDWHAYFEDQWEHLIKGEMPPTYEYQIIHKSGEVRWLNQRNILVRDDAGNPIAIEGIVTDITKRKRAEEALQVSESRYKSIIAVSNTGAWEYHRNTDYLWCSPEYFTMLGYDPADFEMSGKANLKETWIDLLHPDDRDKAANHFAQYLKNGSVGMYENYFRLSHKNGSWAWIWSRGQTLRTKDGDLTDLTVGTHINITERKQAEEELRIYHEHLEELVKERTVNLEAANKELETFSYSVSHDLRAPLRTIDGFGQALLEDYDNKLDAQGRDYLTRIRTATRHMAELIEDMLKLSRITRTEISITEINLTEIAQSVIDELQKSEPKRNINIKIAGGLKDKADARLMRIALENLLGNAWKFTSKQPDALIEFGSTKKDNTTVYFIRDNGAGFNMSYANKLFIPFQRLHTENEYPGTGIGLATVRRIIFRHGGTIWAEGAINKGATFYFNLHS